MYDVQITKFDIMQNQYGNLLSEPHQSYLEKSDIVLF